MIAPSTSASTSVELTIDGRAVRARPGETVLEAARRAGIEVPTLCFLEGLEGYGACRLCVVEVAAPGGNGERAAAPGKIVASCRHPASAGLEVRTRSERVDLVRRTVVDLLLARCPGSEEVRRMAASLGVARSSFPPDARADRCTLCGTCVRVCAEVGPRAISAAGRGPSRRVAPPFDEPPDACVGCLSCAKACPTGNIPFEEEGARRRIWGREFERVACPGCGRRGATREQIAHYAKAHGFEEGALALCDACKRAATARTFFDLMRL